MPFWCPFFKTDLSVHESDVGVWLARVTTSDPHTKLGDDEMKGGEAYWPWDQEAGEEVEERVKEGAEDGCEYKVGSDGYHHHAVVCEHEQADACDVHVPEKLCRHPFKPKH